jgi:hypothetical protein
MVCCKSLGHAADGFPLAGGASFAASDVVQLAKPNHKIKKAMRVCFIVASWRNIDIL